MDRFNYTGVCWLGNEGGRGGVVRGRAKIVDNAVFGAAKKKKQKKKKQLQKAAFAIFVCAKCACVCVCVSLCLFAKLNGLVCSWAPILKFQ